MHRIDAEIERLQQLHQPVANAADAGTVTAKSAKAARKGMSSEGRRKIAEARWAKQKKATKSAAKASTKETANENAAAKRPAKKSAAVKTAEQA